MTALIKLLDQLDQSRERLLMAIESLPDEALLVQGAVGAYAVVDVLGVLTAWDAELVTGLMRLQQEKKPGKLLQALANREAYQRQVFAENQGRNLDQIFDDFQHVRLQLETWLEEFSDKELTQHNRYPWFEGKALKQIVAETTIELEAAFLPDLTAFGEQWQESAWPGSDEVIPLTAVSRENDNDNDSQPDSG